MRHRVIRNGLIAFAALLVLAIAAGAIAIARFDPNDFKPRIVAAVQQATGRQLTLNGPISLRPSLWPTVALHDVSLANPPGFSRPAMATLQQLDVQLALWPLLFRAVEIERLVLIKPDIQLETDAKGRNNWSFAPPHAAAPAQPAQTTQAPQTGGTQSATQISVNHLRIEDGTLHYRDDGTGRSMTLALHRFDASASSPQRPLHLTADAAYDGTPFTLAATLGPVARLLDPDATTPWPVQATLQSGSARLSVDGSLRQPLQGHGYDVALIGNIPDLAALNRLLPNTQLPPLHDVRFSTRLREQENQPPEISALTLQVGASDLDSVQPGLRLQALDVSAPSLTQPMQLKLQAQLASAPLQLAGTVGSPAALLGTPVAGKQSWPVDLTGQAAGADLAVKGQVAQPKLLKGVDLQISARAADLAALGPILHQKMPALKSVAFSARVTDGSGGLAHQVTLHDLKLTMPEADLSGDMSLALGARPDVTAKLTAGRIDADALMAAFRPMAATPPANPAQPAPPPPAPAPRPSASGPLIPDTPLPFALLRTADADIALTAKAVKSGGAEYRNIATHLVLRNGKLRLDPFTADLPQGHVTLTLDADGSVAQPPVALTLHAPALALKPLFAALHQPDFASGNVDVQADLHGAGTSLHAIAAGLDGSVGLAMEHGTVDVQLLEKLLGPALAKANVLSLLTHGGTSQVECFAFRMDARHGIGEVRALTLSSSALSFDGGGSVNLGNETLALNLRPQGRIGGTGFVVPLRITGSLRDPNVAVNAAAAAGSDLGALAGSLGSGSSLGAIAGVLMGGKQVAGGVSCAGPLAIARGQKPPAQAAPAQAAPAQTAPAKPAAKPALPRNPADLLKQFLR